MIAICARTHPGIPELEGTVAAQGVALISELFHLDGLCDKSKDKDRKDYRRTRHPSLHPWAEELGQRRFHPRSRSQRRHVQPGRDCKSKRTPGLRISGICADRACSTPG